jgi:hypothetical protein
MSRNRPFSGAWSLGGTVDPVSLIVAALMAGASAGVADSAKDAVGGLYEKLKTALAERFSQGDPAGGRTLERYAGNPTGYETPVRDLITETGADQDDSILDVARQLLAAADPDGAQVGKYNVKVIGGNVGAIGDNAAVTQHIGTPTTI